MLHFQSDGDTRGILDGKIVVRFTHATNSQAGTESHIGYLNKMLLERNRMTILYFFLSEDKCATISETKSGMGKIIKVPMYIKEHSPDTVYESFFENISERVINSRNYRLVKEWFLPVVSDILVLASFAKQNNGFSNWVESDITSLIDDMFSRYKIDLLINHHAGGSDSLRMMQTASSRNIPILIVNHFSNVRFYRPGIREQLHYAQAVAGLSMVDVPFFLRNRLINLSNGIDTDFFNPTQFSINSDSETTNTSYILLPARIIRTKGQIELLKIALELRKEQIECTLVFAGRCCSDNYKKELDRFIADHGLKDNVIYTGMIDQSTLREWYHKSKIVVLPTYHQEGVPRVLLEAQAMEVPVISYLRGGVSDAIIQNSTGFYYKCGDRISMRKKIAELLKNEKERIQIGKKGRDFILRKFSLLQLAQRHENIYSQLINNQL